MGFGSAGNGEVTSSVSEDSAPSGRGFSRHEGLSSDARFCLSMPAREGTPPALFGIGSMSPTRLSLSMVASLIVTPRKASAKEEIFTAVVAAAAVEMWKFWVC